MTMAEFNAMADARSRKIGEVTVIGAYLVGMSKAGGLYKFHRGRWVRLEVADQTERRLRRPLIYSGDSREAAT